MVFDPAQRDEAMRQANAVMRVFLGKFFLSIYIETPTGFFFIPTVTWQNPSLSGRLVSVCCHLIFHDTITVILFHSTVKIHESKEISFPVMKFFNNVECFELCEYKPDQRPVIFDITAAKKLTATREVFNKLPPGSIDVIMRNWQTQVGRLYNFCFKSLLKSSTLMHWKYRSVFPKIVQV